MEPSECEGGVEASAGPISEEDEELLRFLRSVRRASPAEIRKRFKVPKTTLYRRLKNLESHGLVKKSGTSRAVVYEAAA